MSDRPTIDVSSTMTTSCGRRLPRWWRKRLWLSGRQPSRRCSVDAPSACSCSRTAGSTASALASSWTASCSRGGGLAGRRGEGDERRRRARRGGLLGQQRDDPRDRRRLAGARAAATTAKRRWTAEAARAPGGLGVLGEQACRARRAARPTASAPAREHLEVGRHLALLAPVAVEVEQAARQPQRAARRRRRPPRADQRASGRRDSHACGSGHGRTESRRPPRRRRWRSPGCGRDRRTHDRGAGRARQGRRPADLVVLLAGQRGEAQGDVGRRRRSARRRR
jgi:hypothetical protein